MKEQRVRGLGAVVLQGSFATEKLLWAVETARGNGERKSGSIGEIESDFCGLGNGSVVSVVTSESDWWKSRNELVSRLLPRLTFGHRSEPLWYVDRSEPVPRLLLRSTSSPWPAYLHQR